MTSIDEVLKKADRMKADREKAAGKGGSRAFEDALLSRLNIGDKTIRIRSQTFGSSMNTDQIFVNFYNVPESMARGATGENNRLMIVVDGFSRESVDAPPPKGKIKAEVSVNMYRGRGDTPRLRAKSGQIDAIAKYVADYINLIAATQAPVL